MGAATAMENQKIKIAELGEGCHRHSDVWEVHSRLQLLQKSKLYDERDRILLDLLLLFWLTFIFASLQSGDIQTQRPWGFWQPRAEGSREEASSPSLTLLCLQTWGWEDVKATLAGQSAITVESCCTNGPDSTRHFK